MPFSFAFISANYYMFMKPLTWQNDDECTPFFTSNNTSFFCPFSWPNLYILHVLSIMHKTLTKLTSKECSGTRYVHVRQESGVIKCWWAIVSYFAESIQFSMKYTFCRLYLFYAQFYTPINSIRAIDCVVRRSYLVNRPIQGLL